MLACMIYLFSLFQISTNANTQMSTHVLATATTHREGIYATALVASRETRINRKDAKVRST